MPISASQFRDLVSGRRRGIFASLARGGLWLVSLGYAGVMWLRNRRYDKGRATIGQAGVPVISVGNLTMGGTGKTPAVEWICRFIRERQIRVTIVSRGYGSDPAAGRNDEAMELERKLPDVPHVQDPDRLAAARIAVEELECQMIVLDDAFQHRRIARDLDVVMVDALEPFGFGHVFPRGTLREPLASLSRADAIILSRGDMLDADQREALRQRFASLAPDAVWATTTHAPRCLVDAQGTESPLEVSPETRVAAFCGLGNPAGFRHTLESCGLTPVAFREFPDHHGYDRSDVDSLIEWLDSERIDLAVCTEKDQVKLGVDRLGRCPLRALRIGLDFLEGEADLAAAIDTVIARVDRE